ncbi:TPA: hypothetical protein HA335_01015 [Methanocaldococcus jannaschii]|uniref:Uncharacterized protein n=1 Tax=Methanocaldococcus jannaschii TaxID=2190 RepID=A0A832SUH2_9EURY|nr:hypothetical protein [Methanocaldococcus jannaschii]
MNLWSERIKDREVVEVIGCERVPLNETLNEIVVLFDEYTKRGDYKVEIFDDVFNYYHNRILTNDEFIDGVARIKLGLDTRNHAKEWLLEVVNWFAGNRYNLRDEEIKLGNRLRDWMNIGVSLVIPKELKPKFDEFYKMAKKFDWQVEIRNEMIFKTTLNGKEVYTFILMGDVVNERLDNILDGGGVFDLGKRVVCDDEWFSGWLVRDIDVNKKYNGSVGHVEFEKPGNSGYFSGECFNKKEKYKDKKYGSKIGKSKKSNPTIEKKKEKWAELLSIIFGSKPREDEIDSVDRYMTKLFLRIIFIPDYTNKIHDLSENVSKNIKNLIMELKSGNIFEINKILDDLEYNIYTIDDESLTIKERVYNAVEIIFKVVSNEILRTESIDDKELEIIKKLHELVVLTDKVLRITYNSLNRSLEDINSYRRIIANNNLPDDIIRRLNIINAYIEKIKSDILSMRENEQRVLIICLSKFYNLYLSKDKKEREKLADEIKNLIEYLYFDWYYDFIDNIGEYEFKFIKNIAAMCLLYDYTKELEKDGSKEMFNHVIFKILRNGGFKVKEYDIIETLLNIRENLPKSSKIDVRYFDKELIKIIRGIVRESKKDVFYNNMKRLKEFVEELREMEKKLSEANNITLHDLRKLGFNDMFL